MPRLLTAGLILSLTAAPLAAQDRHWSRADDWPRASAARGAGEGKVAVASFRADSAEAQALGKGAIAALRGTDFSAAASEREAATYEAAVLDALGRRGYAISGAADAADQQVELRITREIAMPEEAPRKPVSGEMSVGVGTHGSMMGLGLRLDLTKPKKALIATRLEARIRSKATGALLWEGRADIRTREGSDRWDDQTIASRLAEALFERFPEASG